MPHRDGSLKVSQVPDAKRDMEDCQLRYFSRKMENPADNH
jgi:hypothetical protein